MAAFDKVVQQLPVGMELLLAFDDQTCLYSCCCPGHMTRPVHCFSDHQRNQSKALHMLPVTSIHMLKARQEWVGGGPSDGGDAVASKARHGNVCKHEDRLCS